MGQAPEELAEEHPVVRCEVGPELRRLPGALRLDEALERLRDLAAAHPCVRIARRQVRQHVLLHPVTALGFFKLARDDLELVTVLGDHRDTDEVERRAVSDELCVEEEAHGYFSYGP